MMIEKSTNPFEGSEISTILVVSDINKSKEFYIDGLGATIFREYGGTSMVIEFLGHWLVLVTSGEPSADKPTTSFLPPENLDSVSHSFTIRVKDCHRSYSILLEKGIDFITPPYDWGAEIRCFFRDPDGHLFEISEYRA